MSYPKNKSDRDDDLSEISDRMESIMARYQHIPIPTSDATLNAHALLQIAQRRLSVDTEKNTALQAENPEMKQDVVDTEGDSEAVQMADAEADTELKKNILEPSLNEVAPEISSSESFQSLNSQNDTEGNPSNETKMAFKVSDNRTRSQKEKDELWALLNYTKVRLATGTTPTTSEAIALGMKQESVSQFQNSRSEKRQEKDPKEQKRIQHSSLLSDHGNNDTTLNSYRDDFYSSKDDEGPKVLDDYHDDDDNYNNDDDDNVDDEEDDDDDLPKFTKEQIENSRARAMAALAKTENVLHTKAVPEVSSTSSSKSNTPEKLLTESFLIKSMALAEQAAIAGETEFQTTNRISILEKMSTPTAVRDRYHGKNHTSIPSEPNRKNNVFGRNVRHFFFNTKQKAENLVKGVKSSISKIENRSHLPIKNETGGNSNAVSPLKAFKDNILKVEKMNEEKYGEPWEKSI